MARRVFRSSKSGRLDLRRLHFRRFFALRKFFVGVVTVPEIDARFFTFSKRNRRRQFAGRGSSGRQVNLAQASILAAARTLTTTQSYSG